MRQVAFPGWNGAPSARARAAACQPRHGRNPAGLLPRRRLFIALLQKELGRGPPRAGRGGAGARQYPARLGAGPWPRRLFERASSPARRNRSGRALLYAVTLSISGAIDASSPKTREHVQRFGDLRFQAAGRGRNRGICARGRRPDSGSSIGGLLNWSVLARCQHLLRSSSYWWWVW